jgi:TetR/AcrR family transcriptional regulator, transcriptional repressor for nem operon
MTLTAPRRGAGDDAGTASRILDIAERLVQVRGFNGFSYADIAAELHITKAALHYHFAGKGDLGEALITRYASRFAEALGRADTAGLGPRGKLAAYADLYLQVLRDRKMCLCGMLAAEYQTLPQPMRDAVIGFFDQNESWLEAVLQQGRDEGSLQFTGSARDAARMIVSGLEGAMLIARPYGDIARFQAAAANLLAGLEPAGGQARGDRALAGQAPAGKL